MAAENEDARGFLQVLAKAGLLAADLAEMPAVRNTGSASKGSASLALLQLTELEDELEIAMARIADVRRALELKRDQQPSPKFNRPRSCSLHDDCDAEDARARQQGRLIAHL